MAFTTSTSVANLDVFISDLISFAVTNAGFTNIGNTAIDSDTLYRLSKTTETLTTYWGFRNLDIGGDGAEVSNIIVRSRMLHLSPTAANFIDAPSGAANFTDMGTFNFRGPFTRYYFFTDGNSVFAVLEVRPGIYSHLAFGNMNKIGTWTGGAYLTANNQRRFNNIWNPIDGALTNSQQHIFMCRRSAGPNSTYGGSFFRVGDAGSTNDFQAVCGTTNGINASCNIPPNSGISSADINPISFAIPFGHSVIVRAAPNAFNLRTPIMPVFFFRQSSADPIFSNIYGQVPNIGFFNINNITPGALLDGSWRAFPLVQKSGDNTQATITGIYGVAYKEIP